MEKGSLHNKRAPWELTNVLSKVICEVTENEKTMYDSMNALACGMNVLRRSRHEDDGAFFSYQTSDVTPVSAGRSCASKGLKVKGSQCPVDQCRTKARHRHWRTSVGNRNRRLGTASIPVALAATSGTTAARRCFSGAEIRNLCRFRGRSSAL